MLWSEFRSRFERDAFPALAESTRAKHRAMLNAVETHAKPDRLSSLDADAMGRLTNGLRESGLEDSTIRGHLDNLKTALQWAVEQRYLNEIPKIRMPAKGGMRGRPVTPEEFERMQSSVPRVVDRARVREYRNLLSGLWLSGLRLNEALQLHWEDDRFVCVDLTTGRKPMFRIAQAADKARESRCFPMAPEFVAFIEAIPVERRRGFVFLPDTSRRPSLNWLSKRLTAIGRAARVKVADKRGKVKWASAHDLRRAFGLRWALRVMPPVLMALMRHHQIATTMRYYVGRDSDAAAEAAWEAVQPINEGSVS
jgi:integrase